MHEHYSQNRPLIGIAPDVIEPRPGSVRASCALTYARAVMEAGGMPVILPPLVELIPEQMERFAGFVLTGGDDPRTEEFGEPTHPKATPMHPLRQAYDTALLRALMKRPEVPTLGVCLGMQMMALVSGGAMNQHLPETLATHAQHWSDGTHKVVATAKGIRGGIVTSHHRQAVRDPGTMRVVARSEDGVIEAIDRPGARFCLGVQWHPERTADAALGVGLFRQLVEAARIRV